MELSDPTTVSKVLNFAHQSVVQSSDPTVRDSVSPAVNDALIKAASNAIAAANAQTDKAVDAMQMEKSSYLVQTKVSIHFSIFRRSCFQNSILESTFHF